MWDGRHIHRWRPQERSASCNRSVGTSIRQPHLQQGWRLDDENLRRAVQAEQELRRIEDPWEAIVSSWIEEPTQVKHDGIRVPLALEKGRITVRQVLEHAIVKPAERQSKSDQMRVGKILRALGWTKRTSNGAFW
jgi:predicted P-loop ATPase